MSDAISKADLAVIMDRMWREMVEFPFARVCKHYAAGVVIQEMEKLGIEPPAEIIAAVVEADDEKALAWRREHEARKKEGGR